MVVNNRNVYSRPHKGTPLPFSFQVLPLSWLSTPGSDDSLGDCKGFAQSPSPPTLPCQAILSAHVAFAPARRRSPSQSDSYQPRWAESLWRARVVLAPSQALAVLMHPQTAEKLAVCRAIALRGPRSSLGAELRALERANSYAGLGFPWSQAIRQFLRLSPSDPQTRPSPRLTLPRHPETAC